MENTACPVCGNNSFKKIIKCIDHMVTGEEFDLVQCNQCGFIQTYPIPTIDKIGKYYQSENYISHTNTNKGLINQIYHFVRKKTLKGKLDLINSLTKKGKLLDVGCGTGYFLKECKEDGWGIVGMEPDPSARALASEITGEKIKNDIKEINETFDIITLWHVLEHMHNLKESIEKLKSLLKPNGKLIIAVPNCESYDAQTYGQYWAAYDVPRHLYHFTKDTMNKLITNNGMKIKEIKPMKFDSFYVSMISEKYITKNNNSLLQKLSIPKAFVKGFISNLKASKINNYSSLIYIIER